MFPSSYITVKVPVKESPPTQNHQAPAMTSKPKPPSQPTARALYNFTAEAPEDLSLQVFVDFLFRLIDK